MSFQVRGFGGRCRAPGSFCASKAWGWLNPVSGGTLAPVVLSGFNSSSAVVVVVTPGLLDPELIERPDDPCRLEIELAEEEGTWNMPTGLLGFIFSRFNNAYHPCARRSRGADHPAGAGGVYSGV